MTISSSPKVFPVQNLIRELNSLISPEKSLLFYTPLDCLSVTNPVECAC
jgi:hypothetical protein